MTVQFTSRMRRSTPPDRTDNPLRQPAPQRAPHRIVVAQIRRAGSHAWYFIVCTQMTRTTAISVADQHRHDR
jgi:hypothetical protein